MNTFYSILYVPIRPGVQERLTIGLFMRTPEQVIFRYSQQKLGALRHLLPKPSYNLLKLSLGSIERTAIHAIEDFKATKKGLLPENSMQYQIVNESYFEYLARYNKNLLAFGKPEKINGTATFELFQKLFAKYISEEQLVRQEVIESRDIVLRTHTLLKPRIEKRVNWKFKVTGEHLPNLILPTVTIDFIGKNGQYVAGQVINFENAERFLDNNIAKFIALIDAMSEENDLSKCFILGKEPVKRQFPTQHKLWNNIRESQKMEFVDADEYESVVEYIEKNDVQPLVPFEESE